MARNGKYNVSKVKPTYNGITFDSKGELNHYKLFEDYKNIEVLELQPKFKLLDGFEYYDLVKGKMRKYADFNYKADFKLKIKGFDKLIIWESKGMITEPYQIRKKMWHSIYRNDYYFIQCSSVKGAKEIFSKLGVK